MIRLERISEVNYKECLALSVSKEQEDFISTNAYSLAKAYVYYNTVTPFAVYADDTMIGFMLLRYHEARSWYIIWQFMIDHRYQRRGYGRQAILLAIDWMKKDKNCKQIALAYAEGNIGAEKLYTGLGFKQFGEIVDGEIDMVLDL